ncbi:MAG: hypothetical protein JW827_07955 [Spirochaetes bacterium]|nr:hypothetical protein [Spirochaetota bacterium]
MDFKEQYFFFPDLILPYDDSRIFLKSFTIEDIQIKFKFDDSIIFPVEYSGLFKSYLFLLIQQKDRLNLFNQMDELILPFFEKGKNNLFSIKFKKLNVKIKEPLPSFSVSPGARYTNIVLEYELVLEESLRIPFFILIPMPFLKALLGALFPKSMKEGKSNIKEALELLKFRFYRDSITSFWDLRDFFQALSDKDVQRVINLLLSSNMIEETMLTGLIAGFVTRGTGEKIFRNISKNLKAEIDKNLKLNYPEFRWIDECFYLIKSAIEELLLEDKLDITSLRYLVDIKDRLKEENYKRMFAHKTFQKWISEAKEKKAIDDLRILTPNKIIVRSLKNAESGTINVLKENLTQNALQHFNEDMSFEHRTASSLDIMKARIMVVENLKNIYYDHKVDTMHNFEDILLMLNRLDLNLLVEESGVIEFAQATIRSSQKLKRHIYKNVDGTLKNLLSDIYSGRVRFKSAFGDITINRHRKHILKTYLFLRGEKKIMLLL